jgi:peptidoglycan/LPS O-acetylase OafA/YrhL
MAQGPEKHVDSLDGLRGIAILLVFLFHYQPGIPHNPISWLATVGWSGVDLFFVLSGFLITGILYDTRQSANFFKVFYARRALRLFPLYFVAVGIMLFSGFVSHTPLSWKAIPFYIYGSNIMLGLREGLPAFPPQLECFHFWSLSVEEQFYSLWPLVVFFVRRRRTLMQICAGGILGSLLFRIVLTHFHVSLWILYTELPSRMDALMAGAMLALGLRGPRPESWRSPTKLYLVMGACCLGLVVIFSKAKAFYVGSDDMTSWGYSVFAGLYVSILGLALVPGSLVDRVGTIRVLRFYGRYSYGFYIWHELPAPVTYVWRAWFLRSIRPFSLAQMVYEMAMLALFTGAAVLSYHLLERPFLRLKSHFRYAEPKEKYANNPLAKLRIAPAAPILP